MYLVEYEDTNGKTQYVLFEADSERAARSRVQSKLTTLRKIVDVTENGSYPTDYRATTDAANNIINAQPDSSPNTVASNSVTITQNKAQEIASSLGFQHPDYDFLRNATPIDGGTEETPRFESTQDGVTRRFEVDLSDGKNTTYDFYEQELPGGFTPGFGAEGLPPMPDGFATPFDGDLNPVRAYRENEFYNDPYKNPAMGAIDAFRSQERNQWEMRLRELSSNSETTDGQEAVDLRSKLSRGFPQLPQNPVSLDSNAGTQRTPAVPAENKSAVFGAVSQETGAFKGLRSSSQEMIFGQIARDFNLNLQEAMFEKRDNALNPKKPEGTFSYSDNVQTFTPTPKPENPLPPFEAALRKRIGDPSLVARDKASVGRNEAQHSQRFKPSRINRLFWG